MNKSDRKLFCPFNPYILRYFLSNIEAVEYYTNHREKNCRICYELFKNNKPTSIKNDVSMILTNPRKCPCALFGIGKVTRKAKDMVAKAKLANSNQNFKS